MTALVRTLVPLLWGYVITWLTAAGVPASVLDVIRGWEAPITGAVLLVASAAVYKAANWAVRQSWFPNWIAVLFAGSVKQPHYGPMFFVDGEPSSDFKWKTWPTSVRYEDPEESPTK